MHVSAKVGANGKGDETMCPNCASEQTGSFIKKQNELEDIFNLNKCHECNCVFITFDFENANEIEMEVGMV